MRTHERWSAVASTVLGAYLTRKAGDGALHPPSPVPCSPQFGERVVHVCKVISRHHTPWGKLGPPTCMFGKQRVGQIRQTVGRRTYHRSGDRTQKVVGSGSMCLHLAPSGSTPSDLPGLKVSVDICVPVAGDTGTVLSTCMQGAWCRGGMSSLVECTCAVECTRVEFCITPHPSDDLLVLTNDLVSRLASIWCPGC